MADAGDLVPNTSCDSCGSDRAKSESRPTTTAKVELEVYTLAGERLGIVSAGTTWSVQQLTAVIAELVPVAAASGDCKAVKHIVIGDTQLAEGQTLGDLGVASQATLQVVFGEPLPSLIDKLPGPFAKLLAGKMVVRYGYPTSKWTARSFDVDPPFPVEEHMHIPGRKRGHTIFSDGSHFTDGGVGAGCGPNRYQQAPDESPRHLQELGLTNQNHGLPEEYWVIAPGEELRKPCGSR